MSAPVAWVSMSPYTVLTAVRGAVASLAEERGLVDFVRAQEERALNRIVLVAKVALRESERVHLSDEAVALLEPFLPDARD